jgi:lipopolysaccharide transport protein LptA
VRELGPVVKLLGSPVLVEGGTEVVLDIRVAVPATGESVADFRAHWQHGGPWALKGVATLEQDIGSALQAALQPGGCPRAVTPEPPARRRFYRADPRSSCLPIVIESDRMEVDRTGRLVIFTSLVEAKLEGATLTADRMEVYLDETGTRVPRIIATGGVKVVTGDGKHGTARQAEYDDAEQEVRLLGDARVLSEGNLVAGEKIMLSLEDGREPGARCPRPPPGAPSAGDRPASSILHAAAVPPDSPPDAGHRSPTSGPAAPRTSSADSCARRSPDRAPDWRRRAPSSAREAPPAAVGLQESASLVAC